MARKAMRETVFSSFSDVDNALKEIGAARRELEVIDVAQNERIDAIKEEAKASSTPYVQRIQALELAMKDFCESRRDAFAKTKSMVLTFGSVGFRRSTRVSFKNKAFVLDQLKGHGLCDCIRVKEDIDKEEVKKLPEETIAQIGAKLVCEDTFGYEVAEQNIPAQSIEV